MARHTTTEIAEHSEMQPEAGPRGVVVPARGVHVDERPFQVGDQLPVRMTAADMQRAFGIGKSRFFALVREGKFDRFEILPRIGARAWSGELVARYFRGERIGEPQRSFGRKTFGHR